MITNIRRWLAARRVCHIERELAAVRTAIGCVKDPHISRSLIALREQTRIRLAAARAVYTALHSPGTRFTWSDA